MKKYINIIIFMMFFIIFIWCNNLYARYVLNRNINIKVKSIPFYFEAEVEKAEIELIDRQAEIKLKIKNNDGNNYNLYDTNYRVTLVDNEKFTLKNESVINTISGKCLIDEVLTINLELKENTILKNTEQISIKVSSIYPYEKEIVLESTIVINNQQVIPDFTFSNETYSITMGGYNVYRTDSNLTLNGNIDISKMNYIEFDFFVPEGNDVTKLYGLDSQLEISSSGKYDERERTYGSANYFNEEIIYGSWNHIIIPLQDGEEALGECDLTNINFIGLYWNNTEEAPDNTYTIPNCQIKNFKFTKYLMEQ